MMTGDELDRAWEGIVAVLEAERLRQAEERRVNVKASEAYLDKQVQIRIGELQRITPTIETWAQETGLGYNASIKGVLQGALAPFGPHAVAAALSAIARHRVAYGEPGQPDRWAVVDGRAAGLELKRAKGGALQQNQRDWHDAARRRGVFVTVVREPDDVDRAFERVRRGAVE